MEFASERDLKVNRAGFGENVRARKGVTCPLFLLIYCFFPLEPMKGANGIYPFGIM